MRRNRSRHARSLCGLSISIGFACVAWTCKKSPTSSVQTVIPAAYAGYATLGHGFDSSLAQFTGNLCVQAPGISAPLATSQFRFQKDMSSEDMIKEMSGSLEIMVPVLPVVSAGGGIDYAAEFGSSDTKINYTIVYDGVWGSLVFTETPRVADFTERFPSRSQIAKPDPGSMSIDPRFCGDEYVSSIKLGAKFLGTVSIDFQSSQSKQELGFNVMLEVAGGIIKIKSRLDGTQAELNDEIRVKVGLFQVGGSPESVLKLIPTGIVNCKLNEIAPCEEAILRMMQYVNGEKNLGVPSIPEQLADISGAVPLQYITQKYEGIGISSNTSSQIPIESSNLRANRSNIFNRIIQAEKLLSQFRTIANEKNYDVPTARLYYDKIRTQYNKIVDLRASLDQKYKDCYNKSELCQKAVNEVSKMLDDEFNSAKIDQSLILFRHYPLNFNEWCRQLGALEEQNSGNYFKYYFPSSHLSSYDTWAIMTFLDRLQNFYTDRAPGTLQATVNPENDQYCTFLPKPLAEHVDGLTELLIDKKPGELFLTQITPIMGLPNLQKLAIRGFSVNNLYGLANLTRLSDLDLSHNNLDEFEGLKAGDLPALRNLNISNNYFSDLTRLAEFQNLECLIANEMDSSFVAIKIPPKLKILSIQSGNWDLSAADINNLTASNPGLKIHSRVKDPENIVAKAQVDLIQALNICP